MITGFQPRQAELCSSTSDSGSKFESCNLQLYFVFDIGFDPASDQDLNATSARTCWGIAFSLVAGGAELELAHLHDLAAALSWRIQADALKCALTLHSTLWMLIMEVPAAQNTDDDLLILNMLWVTEDALHRAAIGAMHKAVMPAASAFSLAVLA